MTEMQRRCEAARKAFGLPKSVLATSISAITGEVDPDTVAFWDRIASQLSNPASLWGPMQRAEALDALAEQCRKEYREALDGLADL